MDEVKEYSNRWWMTQIESAKGKFEKFYERGTATQKRYVDERDAVMSRGHNYNLFWANVGILKSALYANPPEPTVKRQFGDFQDDVGRVSAEIMERLLSLGLQEPVGDMDSAFRQAVEDWLIPGAGCLWLRYVPEIQKTTDEFGEEYKKLVDENVVTDYVAWNDMLWGPCKIWSDVPWVARRIMMNKKDAEKRFGEEKAKLLKYKDKPEEKYRTYDDDNDEYPRPKAEIWEIWCKETRKVYMCSESMDQDLEVRKDPLGLKKFFPCPTPLLANTTTASTIPRPDFYMTQDQYNELDYLNLRISLLVEACKAVGVYDRNNKELVRVMEESTENQLIPVNQWAMFAEKGGLKGVIDWVPIDHISMVLERLYAAREDQKQQIYELTGISDIMRGVSAPRETATAQQLKAQYSSARLQFRQEDTARFVQETMRIKGEIISKHFQIETILKKSLIMFSVPQEQAIQAAQLLKSNWDFDYRLEIEADKLSIPDYNAEKQARIEFATTIGQMLAQSQEVVAAVPELGLFILQTIQWVAAGFRSGRQLEGVLDQTIDMVMKKLMNPPPPQPDPALVKAQGELELKKEEAALNAQGKQLDGRLKLGTTMQQMQLDRAKALQEMQVSQAKARNEMALDLVREQFEMDREPQENENSR